MGKAQKQGVLQCETHQLRDYSESKHKTVDDAPYGGGAGMVLRVDVLHKAVSSIKEKTNCKTVLLSPQGKRLSAERAKGWEKEWGDSVLFVCGHYEGVDERFIELCVDEEVSIGDFVLTGGELPSLVLADAVARFIPGVLGNEESSVSDSFEGGLLKYPQYTRPQEFEGLFVPEVLLSGNHQNIEKWRTNYRISRTQSKRPELLGKHCPVYLALLHYPMTNKRSEVVTTSVTNMDIHDISRSARTFGVKTYFLMTPLIEQHEIVGRILSHWKSEQSREFHPDRVEALSRIGLSSSFEEIIETIVKETGERPEVVLTDARPLGKSVSYSSYKGELYDPDRTRPSLVVLGTGWGVSKSFYSNVDRILEPIYGDEGAGGYNHLSVRAAAAIILDRLLGQ